MIGTCWVSGSWPNSAIFLADQFIVGQYFTRCISPKLCAYATMQVLRETLSESICECFQEYRLVVIMRLFERFDMGINSMTGRHCECPDVIYLT